MYIVLKTFRRRQYLQCVSFQNPWRWRIQVRLLFQVLRSKGHIQVVTSFIYLKLFHGIPISLETTCGITLGRNRSNAGFAGRHSRDPSSLLNMRSPMLSGELTDSMTNWLFWIDLHREELTSENNLDIVDSSDTVRIHGFVDLFLQKTAFLLVKSRLGAG